MSQKIYLSILKAGIFLSLLSSLLVFKNLLFPFISGKQIYFNIIVEILAVFWLAFIMKYPEWNPFKSAQGRPQRFLVTYGLIAYFAVIFVSCFTGVDFNLSFWGDVERMLGFFQIIHFLILYFIIITVMRTWQDWKMLFLTSIMIASIVAIYGMIIGKAQTTLGNPAYVAAFMIFNLYFTFILFVKERSLLKWLYIIPAVFIFVAFMKASIAGAVVGLGVSFLVVLFLYAVLNKNKKVRFSSLAFLIIAVAMIGLFAAARDAEFVKNQSWLKPLREVNWQKNTFQTRLISWRAAWDGFGENPILGTGWGNYAVVFDKYFDPNFYNYTKTETFFDRAHNNLVEIVATTGLAGLLTYLFVCVAIFYYLIVGYIKKKINIHDFVLVFALVVAYFIQNLALFDSLVTYLALMATFGYVYWLQTAPEERGGDEQINFWQGLIVAGLVLTALALLPSSDNGFSRAMIFLAGAYWLVVVVSFFSRGNKKKSRENFSNNEKTILIIAGLVAIFVIYNFNVKPYGAMAGTIKSQVAYHQGEFLESYELAQESLSKDTVLDRDVRVTYIKSFSNTGIISFVKNKYPERAEEFFTYAVDLGKKNVEYNPSDCLNQQFLSQAFLALATFHATDQEKFKYYTSLAIEAIDQAIAASQGRPTTYFVKARLHTSRGEKDKAIEASNYAVGLNPDYYAGYCSLAQIYSTFGDEAMSVENMDKCIDLGGLVSANSKEFLDILVAHYLHREDGERLLKIYQRYVKIDPKNVQAWTNLANLYEKAGQKSEAIKAARKAAELDPSLENVVESFIRELEK